MYPRAPKSRTEIERLLLTELQACEGCEGAAGVSIVGWPDFLPEAPNWTVAQFKPGTADDYDCERALIVIVERFQGFYELVQKH
ncbi:MAG TPA: hypothetical protein VNR11_03890 [Xanthobacteraceae bacterium]|nr:hypothetical protein [Xanthobacteraceae bacterium]